MDRIGKIVSDILEFQYEENYLISILIDNSFTCGIMNVVNNKIIYNGTETYKVFNKIDNIYFKNDEDLYNNGIYIYKLFNKKIVDYKYISINKINISDIKEVGYIVLYKLYNLNPFQKEDKENLKINLLIENIFNKENDNIGKTNLYFNDTNIQIVTNKNYFDSKKHIYDDYMILENIGIENIIRDKFISSLMRKEFKEIDDNQFLIGLKIDSINYEYYRINYLFSPTKKTEFFGVFVFKYVSISDYTKDMLESVSMSIFVNNSNIVDVTKYDIS